MIKSESDYSDQTFKDLALVSAQITDTTFLGCSFERCVMVESIFQNCRFVDCLVEKCDCSLLQIPNSVFSNSRFEGTKLIGVNWSLANWLERGIGDPLVFKNCSLSHSTFLGVHLGAVIFRRCELVNVDFRETNVSGADFAFSDLRDSIFLSSDLSNADLRNARNYHIDPSQNKIKKARFSLPEAMALLYSMDIELSES